MASLLAMPCPLSLTEIEIATMPLRHPDPSSLPKLNTPQRLRETALELFACRGYQSTSLRDIAAHLGVHAGSIYNHVDSKQVLLFELIEDALNELLHTTRKKLKQATEESANLSIFIKVFMNFKKADRRRLLLVSRECVNLTPEQRQYITDLQAQYTRCLSDILHSATTTLDLPHNDVHAVASTIVAILLNTSLWKNGTAAGITDEILMDMLIKGLAGTPSDQCEC